MCYQNCNCWLPRTCVHYCNCHPIIWNPPVVIQQPVIYKPIFVESNTQATINKLAGRHK